MREFFRNNIAFYGAILLFAIFLQWVVAYAYEEDLRKADAGVKKFETLYQEHYTQGVPPTIINQDLNVLQKRIVDGYAALRDQISFQAREDYRIDPKASYPGLVYQEKLKLFHEKNKARMEQLTGKLNTSFSSGNQLDLNAERANELLLQASIVEELLERLELSQTLALIDSFSATMPRTESGQLLSKPIKKANRYPFVLELNATLHELDQLFAGLRAGNGYFFLEDLEMQQGNDLAKWGDKIECRIVLSAIGMEIDSAEFPSTPNPPDWASRAGLR